MIIMMINAIAYCGKTMIIFIAGLESIPNMYNEAASIDGANAWQVFKHITMPMLLPALTTSLVLNIIGGLKMFGLVVAMTNGGPGYASHSLSSLINNLYFANQQAAGRHACGCPSAVFMRMFSWYIDGRRMSSEKPTAMSTRAVPPPKSVDRLASAQ